MFSSKLENSARIIFAGLVLACCGPTYSATTIRILTTYSDDVLYGYGGSVSTINDVVNRQIANLNTAFVNSGISAVAVSVGITSFSDPAATSIASMPATGQKSLSLRLKRDASGADVVMMLGYFIGDIAGYAPQIGSDAGTAFASVNVNSLSVNVYQHEFAHLLGARHQFSGGISSDDSAPGRSHGAYVRIRYGDPGAGGNADGSLCLQTIMAYQPVNGLADVWCSISTPVLWFSTPSPANVYVVGGGWMVPRRSFGGNFRNTTYFDYNNAAQIQSMVPIAGLFHVQKLAGGVIGGIGSIVMNILITDP